LKILFNCVWRLSILFQVRAESRTDHFSKEFILKK